MTGIKLNKHKFEAFNDCDGWGIFNKEREEKYKTLTVEQSTNFDYEGHIDFLTDKLFEKFEYVLVTPDDKIYGVSGEKYVLLSEDEGAFECASKL